MELLLHFSCQGTSENEKKKKKVSLSLSFFLSNGFVSSNEKRVEFHFISFQDMSVFCERCMENCLYH